MTKDDKHIWLFKTLYDSPGGITLKALSDKWREKMSYDGKPLNRTTFDRWKNTVEAQFDVTIENEKRPPYRYYIANRESVDGDKLSKWLLDSFTIGSALADTRGIKNRILLESIPSGHAHLATIVAAMKNNHRLLITYRGFGRCRGATFPIAPLCVKLYKNRWYVVGRCFYRNKTREIIYGLDRIVEAVETEEVFKYPDDFDAEEFFEGTLGVSLYGNVRIETIRIRVEYPHAYYVKTLPMHPSQQLIADEEGEYAVFDLRVRPTEEFFMEMLHGGAWIRVLSPDHVVEQMKGWVNDLYNVYNGK